MPHLLANTSAAGQPYAQTVIGLLVLVSGLIWLAGRVRIAYPIFLVIGGLAIAGFSLAGLPLPRVPVDPELIFLLFLPPLLYQAGLDTSWRDFRANLGLIAMLAIGLVLATTLAVAWGAHSLLHLTWPAAFALGAIVSPPDAAAATSVMSRLGIPKRIITILEGESLVNDASALVVFAFALEAAESSTAFSLSAAGVQFVWVSVAGVGVGLLIGYLACRLRQRMTSGDPFVTLVALLVPYVAYLPAEWVHSSGVLAVVSAGLFVGRRLPRIASSEQRLRERAVWETLVLVINGVVFVLIGLQLPSVVEAIRDDPRYSLGQLLAATFTISMVVIGVRFAWNQVALAAHGVLRRAGIARGEFFTPPQLVLVSWAGMRGIVSLATAIALPKGFPGREPIVFVAFGVILITLVGQGLTFAPLIRRLGLAPDEIGEREQALARRELAYAAVGRLDAMEMIGEAPPGAIELVRASYAARIMRCTQQIESGGDGTDPVGSPAETNVARLDVERAALEAERDMLIKLRDDDLIADEVLRHVQAELDLAELRLRAELEVSAGI